MPLRVYFIIILATENASLLDGKVSNYLDIFDINNLAMNILIQE
jgi:hypothetical protein